MAILFVPMPMTSAYFLKRDPQLVERRLRTEEKITEQKTIIRWAQWVVFASLVIPGLDYRFGWSRVPVWLTILSQLFVFAGYLITLWVMKENSFASRTVQIEEGQRVISTGPYRLVRHPMYFGAVLMASGAWLLVGTPGLPPGHPVDRPPPPQRRKNASPRPPRLFRILPPHPFPSPPPLLVVSLKKKQSLPSFIYFPALHGKAPANAIEAM